MKAREEEQAREFAEKEREIGAQWQAHMDSEMAAKEEEYNSKLQEILSKYTGKELIDHEEQCEIISTS